MWFQLTCRWWRRCRPTQSSSGPTRRSTCTGASRFTTFQTFVTLQRMQSRSPSSLHDNPLTHNPLPVRYSNALRDTPRRAARTSEIAATARHSHDLGHCSMTTLRRFTHTFRLCLFFFFLRENAILFESTNKLRNPTLFACYQI